MVREQRRPTNRWISPHLGTLYSSRQALRAPCKALGLLLLVLFALDTRLVRAQAPPRPTNSNAIDLTAGQRALQFNYLTQSPFSGVANDLDYGFLLSKNRDLIGTGALMWDASFLELHRVRVQVGPRADIALLNTNNTDVVAIYAGADASIELIRRLHFSVYGSAFWAPSVLIFGQAKSVTDFIAGGQIELVSHLSVLAGYRWFRFYLTNGPSENVDNTVFVGFRWVL